MYSIHSADVYAISSHPMRPFTYLSCSRDTTVRLWELQGGFKSMRSLSLQNLSLVRELGGFRLQGKWSEIIAEVPPFVEAVLPYALGLNAFI